MALALIRPTKILPLPDGAGAYPAYKILTLAGWRWRLSGLRQPHFAG